MAKKYLLCCLFLLVYNLAFTQILNFKAISIALFISTPYRISCNQFENRFQERKEVEVKSLTTLKLIGKLFSKFKPAKGIAGIDVRGKLIVQKTNKQREEICFDQFGHFLIKGIIYKNKDLFLFLLEEKMIEE